MDRIDILEQKLNATAVTCARLRRYVYLLSACLVGACLLGAAEGVVQTINGNVTITGNLVVGGKVNGVDVQRGEVHFGMMVPYFGKDLPKGFCWADGKTPWPDADWVPIELHGKNVPDMNGELIGGTSNVADLGQPWTKGVISLAVNKATSGEILFWRRGGVVPKHLQTDGPDAQIESVGKLKYVEHVAFEGDNSTFPFNSTKQNPRYVQCRWIIRIE